MMQDDFHIGKMRQTGILKQNHPVANSSGGEDDNYTTVLTTRGWLRKDSGNINLLTGQITLTKTYTWICRFQQAITVNVDTTWFIGGQEYVLEDYELIDEIKHLYKFNLRKDE